MSNATLNPRDIVDRLDERQEELIQRIDELNARIEATLAELFRSRDGQEPKQDARRAA